MQQIFSNTTLTVNQLIEKIDTGELGLPELQRPFIWKDSKVRDLFDSMMRGYPIGYLMLWECPSLDKKKSIGVDAHSYDSPKEVIIDGQQRLTSLYAVMKGKKVINSKFDEKSIIVCAGLSDEQIRAMEEENALPHGWENMPYEDFLIERRKLMAAKIKAAFEILKKAAT